MGQVNEPLGDGAKTTAKLSLITLHPTSVDEYFTMELKLQGLPQDFPSLPIIAPVSVEHSGRIIADGRMAKHNAAFIPDPDIAGYKSTECSANLYVKDATLFQNFFETILRDKEVDVLLRGDFANVPYQEVLKVKGFDSFRESVTISNLKIEGSDAAGESVLVTLMATIINSSNICLTNVDLTARSKFGYAEIQGLDLRPGSNEREVRCTFKPTGSHYNLGTFIVQYLLSEKKISMSFYIESIGADICGHRYNLRQLGVEATIQGIYARFIKSVTVYIGGSILHRRISFSFELENPADTKITVSDMDLEVYTLTGSNMVCKVKTTFPAPSDYGAFTIPARRTRQSPKFTTDLHLGYMAALKLLGKPIIRAEAVSLTIFVDKFKLPDLKFTLPRVHFRWKISLSD